MQKPIQRNTRTLSLIAGLAFVGMPGIATAKSVYGDYTYATFGDNHERAVRLAKTYARGKARSNCRDEGGRPDEGNLYTVSDRRKGDKYIVDARWVVNCRFD